MTIKLTELTSGGGCGCKLSPVLLRQLLEQARINESPPAALLVGAQTSDDAAVWRLSADVAVIATTDFFSPVVDTPRDFGQIAAANAISDVYAMGGRPLFALALAAMPKDLLPPAVIGDIFGGGREVCDRAGIVIAGGHSIDAKEPIYGLAVVGQVHPDQLLSNAGARPGDRLILGKPLGVGVMSAALKRGQLTPEEYNTMLATTTQLNSAGAQLAQLDDAHALTDVTGFGLLGHLLEMCRASRCAAAVKFSTLPLLPAAVKYVQQGIVTGASARNWKNAKEATHLHDGLMPWQRHLLTDPQTSGGLLLACAPPAVTTALEIFEQHGQQAAVIGEMQNASGKPEIHVA